MGIFLKTSSCEHVKSVSENCWFQKWHLRVNGAQLTSHPQLMMLHMEPGTWSRTPDRAAGEERKEEKTKHVLSAERHLEVEGRYTMMRTATPHPPNPPATTSSSSSSPHSLNRLVTMRPVVAAAIIIITIVVISDSVQSARHCGGLGSYQWLAR